MSNNDFKLTIHMISSLDGMIAKKDNSIEWFDTASNYEKGIDSPDHEEFLKNIDCYIMGSHSYELAMELSKDYGWVYGDKSCIVLTSRNLPLQNEQIQFYSGELDRLVNDKLKLNYKNVWLVGGSKLCKNFMRQNLVDEIRVSILPIVLGNGLAFFDQIDTEFKLNLLDCQAYKNGMVELTYQVIKY